MLKTGQSIDMSGSVKILEGGMPDVGDLLFYGDVPEPWFATFRPDQRGRYQASSRVDGAEDGSITLDSGLRLPLAPTYRELGGPIEPDAPVRYVINERGEVTELR